MLATTIIGYSVTVLVVLVSWVYVYFRWVFSYWKRKDVFFVEPSFPFGNAREMVLNDKSMNILFSDLHKKIQGPYGGIFLFNSPAILLKDPEVIRHILVKDFNNFSDRGMYIDEEREPLSGHLFRLKGDRWRRMRSKLTPSFTGGKMKMMFETFIKTGYELEEALSTVTTEGETVNISDCMLRYSSDVIASVIFGIEVNSLRDRENRWWDMVHNLVRDIPYSRMLIFMLVAFMPKTFRCLGITSLHEKSTAPVYALAQEVMKYREDNKVTRKDFMQLLIELKNKGVVNKEDTLSNDVYDKNSGTDRLSLNEVTAQAYTMFFTGFETTATTTTYCLYELACNPKVQVRLQEEMDQCLAKHGGEVTYDIITEMPYLECVLNEAMRMHPVLAFLKRGTVADYKIPFSEVILEKDTNVFISVLGLHMDPENFPEPKVFKPERFLPENRDNIRPYTFLPFGEGPRNCIGKRMGYLQVSVALIMFLRKYTVSVCDETERELKPHPYSLAFAPANEIKLKVSKRIQK